MTETAILDDHALLKDLSAETILAEMGEGDDLPAVLLPYQQDAVDVIDNTPRCVLVVEKSRRIGYTWGLGASAVLQASRSKAEGGSNVLYISYAQDMTREFIDVCGMWAKAFSAAAAQFEEFIFEDEMEGGETRAIKAFRINFSTGFYIVGLSSAPRSLRGKQGMVIIDEAAFVDNLPQLLKSALALRMWGGKVIVCSTHFGVDNPFNELVREIITGKKKYLHRRVDFDDALKQGLYKRICLVAGEGWSPEKEEDWRDDIISSYGDAADEELFCVPSQGSGAWLTTELIERQMKLPADEHILRWQWPKDYLGWGEGQQQRHMAERLAELDTCLARLDKQERHALGFDFARVASGDLSIAAVLAVDHMLGRAAKLVLEMRGVPYEEQKKIIEHIWTKLPRKAGAAFDATGAGGYVAEAMSRRHGKYEPKDETGGAIAEIKLSVEWYRLHMPRVKSAFEDGTVILPRDALLLGDLRLVKMVKGVAQVPDTRTGEAGSKRHGDFAIALALAWYATLMNVAEYAYEGLAGRAAGSRDDFNTPPSDRDFGHSGWREPLGRSLRGSL